MLRHNVREASVLTWKLPLLDAVHPTVRNRKIPNRSHCLGTTYIENHNLTCLELTHTELRRLAYLWWLSKPLYPLIIVIP